MTGNIWRKGGTHQLYFFGFYKDRLEPVGYNSL